MRKEKLIYCHYFRLHCNWNKTCIFK